MRPAPTGLAALLVVSLLTAGCLSGGAGTATRTPTPGPGTPTGAPDSSPSAVARCPASDTGTRTADGGASTVATGTPRATERGFEFAPGRETPVLLRNERNEAVEVRVRVVCETTGETVHEGAYLVASGTGPPLRTLDLSRANPDAGVRLRVVVTARNTTESTTVETTACADVTGEVRADGGVRVWATC